MTGTTNTENSPTDEEQRSQKIDFMDQNKVISIENNIENEENGSSILSKTNDIKQEFPQSEVVSKVAKLSVDQTQSQTSENHIQTTKNICVVGHVDSGKSSLIGKIAQIVENSSAPVKSKPNKNSKNEPVIHFANTTIYTGCQDLLLNYL